MPREGRNAAVGRGLLRACLALWTALIPACASGPTAARRDAAEALQPKPAEEEEAAVPERYSESARQPGLPPPLRTASFAQRPQHDQQGEGKAEPLLPPFSFPANETSYPIDLPTTLRLAGANNLQIALAAERVEEAYAALDQARVLWLPSLRAGLVYNKHDGRLQETEGEILEVSRGSLFVGGGVGWGSSPPAAGRRRIARRRGLTLRA